jgi:hypothetical protein
MTDCDSIPAPPEQSVTQKGDLWILGEHRLLCGDMSASAMLTSEKKGCTEIILIKIKNSYCFFLFRCYISFCFHAVFPFVDL